MEKQTWQAPEIKELSIEQTAGGPVASVVETGSRFINTSVP